MIANSVVGQDQNLRIEEIKLTSQKNWSVIDSAFELGNRFLDFKKFVLLCKDQTLKC